MQWEEKAERDQNLSAGERRGAFQTDGGGCCPTRRRPVQPAVERITRAAGDVPVST